MNKALGDMAVGRGGTPPASGGVCRSCLCTSSEMKPLNSQMEGDTRTIWEILTFVTNLSIKDVENFPRELCADCLCDVRIADSFKRKCLKSEETLRHSLLPTKTIESNSGDFKLFCRNCTVYFSNESDHLQHLVYHENPYQCSICMLRFSNTGFLEYHLSFSHNPKNPQVKKVECEYCGETFMCDTTFGTHLKLCAANSVSNALSSIEIKPETAFSDSPSDSFDADCKVDENDLACPKSYTCDDCDERFVAKRAYKQHMKESHSTKPRLLKRKKPDQPTSNTDDEIENTTVTNGKVRLKLHLNKNAKTGTVKTENVKVKLANMNNTEVLEAANVQHEEMQRRVPLTCSMCERSFTKKSSLQNHLKKHEAKANERHTCNICKREFIHRAHLDNHVLSAHSSKDGFKCDYCPKSFTKQDSLNLHLDSHKDQKKHQCQFCEKAFNMLSTLKDHLRIHTGEKPFLCSTCGRGFSQKTNLKEHMRRHLGLKPYPCGTCDQRFVSKGELVAHGRKHSGAHPFVCEGCGVGFTTSSSLVKHRRIHTGERPYLCDLCPMRFTALGTLKNHRRTHTGEKPFKCTYCEKAFAQKNDLVSHTRCHTGERPFVCPVCGQAFRQGSVLKTHLKVHSLKDSDSAAASLDALQPPEKDDWCVHLFFTRFCELSLLTFFFCSTEPCSRVGLRALLAA